jgi:DNA topoisomerase-1
MQVSIRFSHEKYEFAASGSTSIFDGWKLVWNFSSAEDKVLPALTQGTNCAIKNIVAEQKFTQPPSRYTKSSITKMYEETGIGRPSTYANITKTLKDRKYIEAVGNSFKATDLGIKVCEFLLKANFCFIDLSFTSMMEEKLDKIGDKELKKLDVLQEFWQRLKTDIDNAQLIKNSNSVTEFDCELCKNKLMKKFSKFGAFYACSNKECKFIANLSEDGTPIAKQIKERKYSEFTCHICSKKMLHRSGKFGDFLGCEDYPKCRAMRKSDGSIIESKPKNFRFKKKNNKTVGDET